MMRRPIAKALFVLVLAAGWAVAAATAALAQEREPAAGFVALLEDMLSTPDRQIMLEGLQGVFSANPKADKITVHDRDGPWLELEGVEAAWSRAALLDRMLDIESLRAREVTLLRRPLPPREPSTGGGFAALPIAVTIGVISLPRIVLAEPVAGAEAELAAAGSAQLTPEALAAQLSVFRQDRAGALTLDLRLQPDANVFSADVTLEEPADGLLAELLDLPNRPAVAARLSGSGPLDDWRATLDARAGDDEVLDGRLAISRGDAGYRLEADMTASLERLVPDDYAALLAGESRLKLDVARAEDGALSIDAATLRSAGLDFALSGDLTPDLVPESAMLTLQLGQAGRAGLPFASLFVPGNLSVTSLLVNAELEGGASAPWRAGIVAEGVESDLGGFARLAANASGEAENLAIPSARRTSFLVSATMDGIAAADPDLGAAIGSDLRLAAEGSWAAGAPIALSDLHIVLDDAAASFAGSATAEALEGSFGVTVSDLSRLAGLAGRVLAGGVQVEAEGTLGSDGGFDLKLSGEAFDLALGVAALDPLLAGATTLAGRVARDDAGLSADDLAFSNAAMTAEVNGAFAGPALDLSVSANLADLSLVTERAAGEARISAELSGTGDAPRVQAEANGENVVLMGRPLADAAARFSGIVAGPDTSGEAEMSGTLAGAPVSGSAQLVAGENGARLLQDVVLSVGESELTGDLVIGSDGLVSGNVSAISPDLSKVAPLFLVEARGMLRAEIALVAEDGNQSATISATATDVGYERVTIGTAEIEGRGSDLLAAPQIEGDFLLRNLVAGGLTIVSADGTAARQGQTTLLTADAELADGRATLMASLAPRDGGLSIGLDRFGFVRGGIDLSLAAPTTIMVADGTARFDDAVLTAGGGRATLSGVAGQDLDLTVDLAAIPAALADNFAPGLGAEGTVSGSVAVSGAAAAPHARFDIAASNASVRASRNAGLGALEVSTRGDYADGRVEIASRLTGADGLAIDVAGTAGAADGAPLDLAIAGTVPLSLGNRQLAARGAALSGALDVDMAVTGTASSPQFAGRVTSEGGGLVDPQSGIVLRNLSLAASVADNRLVIERLNAESGEGTVSAEGALGLDPAAGLPVDLAVRIRDARYVDGTLVAATFDADLTLSGEMAGSPNLAGTVTLKRTEITVPEGLPGDSVAIAVEHVAPPPPVERTLAVLRARQGPAEAGGSRGGIVLDIAVNAPRAIFVRGRGLDTELGGALRLVGPVSAISAAGSFEIVRGRLDILTQRITLDRGIVTFAGDLDPILDFVGTTQSGEVAITVTISGRASDPEITFSSSPELPQDEILAQLIFSRSLGELSPLQIARLGAAASELAGGGGGGLLNQLRATIGLDDLDIIVDEQGEAALAAGRYVSENVYVGVEQGTTAESSRVTIDLDITGDVKARAGYSAEGESSLGIFFEREY